MLNISSNSSHELGNKNQHITGSLYTAHLQIVLEFSFHFWYTIQISILYSNQQLQPPEQPSYRAPKIFSQTMGAIVFLLYFICTFFKICAIELRLQFYYLDLSLATTLRKAVFLYHPV